MRFSAFIIGTAAALPLVASSTHAQETPRPGQVANSAVGQVEQRQTAARIQAEPMGRINNRVANRVQNRIRNRIDRSYNPTANTTSPFEVAAEQITRGQLEQ